MEPHATAAPQGSPDAVHQELYALLAACTEEECAAVLTVLRLLVQEEDPSPSPPRSSPRSTSAAADKRRYRASTRGARGRPPARTASFNVAIDMEHR